MERLSPDFPRPLASLPEQAAADLQFIRKAMERSADFSAVPGLGGMAMGGVALCTAVGVGGRPLDDRWMATWIAAAAVACGIGVLSMRRKALREGFTLRRGPGRCFLMGLCPALLVGALLTAGLARAETHALLPATWLLSYGAGVLAAGTFSHQVVPLTGAAFLAVGAVALAAPGTWGNALMAAGFGGIHLTSGYVVWRHHGG